MVSRVLEESLVVRKEVTGALRAFQWSRFFSNFPGVLKQVLEEGPEVVKLTVGTPVLLQ